MKILDDALHFIAQIQKEEKETKLKCKTYMKTAFAERLIQKA